MSLFKPALSTAIRTIETSDLTAEHVNTLSPPMGKMMEGVVVCNRKYPNMKETWEEDFGN